MFCNIVYGLAKSEFPHGGYPSSKNSIILYVNEGMKCEVVIANRVYTLTNRCLLLTMSISNLDMGFHNIYSILDFA